MLEPFLELHKQGKLAEAESGYREALAFNPDDPEALHLLSIVRRQQGDLVDAIGHARRAVELVPNRPNYLMTLAGLEFHGRLFDESKVHFEAALIEDPNRAGAYSALGHIALINGDFEDAIARFNLALRAGDERIEVLTGYGNALLGNRQIDEALKYLSRASELAPNDAGVIAQVGRAYLKKGVFDFAATALKRSLSLSPQQPLTRIFLAEAELRRGRVRDAEAALAPLLDGPATERSLALVAMGDIARAKRDTLAALAHYRAALDADPRHLAAADALTRALLELGTPGDALAVLDRAIEANPDAVRLLRRKAQVLGLLDRHADGADVLADVAQLEPSAEIYADLATARGLAGAWEDAAEAAAQVGDSEGALSAQARLVSARAALERGDDAAAQAALERIDPASQRPDQRRLTAALEGVLEDRLGRIDKALAAWRRAQALAEATEPEPLPGVDAALLDAAIEAARAASHPLIAQRPRALLLGSPGSGVEIAAALLADQPELDLRSDRFGVDGRRDWLSDPASIAHASPVERDALDRLARRYVRPLERGRVDPARQIVDWLPLFDARVLPYLHGVFGELKLIIVGRDPRDALLNWLALGGAHRDRVADAESAAAWLRSTLDHLAIAARSGRFKLLAIDSDRLIDDAPRQLRQLASFLDLGAIEPGPRFAQVMRAGSGLPSRLPSRRWQAYAESLKAAFARL